MAGVERRAGRPSSSAARCAGGLWRRAPETVTPETVTKDGQNPLRQERSVLQAEGETRRLRPYSVSTGSIATQFDCAVQSPQFSQTRGLISTVVAGWAIAPRLRLRRFSVAQTWS